MPTERTDDLLRAGGWVFGPALEREGPAALRAEDVEDIRIEGHGYRVLK